MPDSRSEQAKAANIQRGHQRRDDFNDITLQLNRWGVFPKGHPRAGCPKPKHPARRTRYGKPGRLAQFLRCYFPAVFFRPMTTGQLEEIETAERVVRAGGQFAFAAPRGDGKTSRVIGYTIYALVHGFRRFVVVVGSEMKSAKRNIFELVKLHLRSNTRLFEDFPEVCVPARLAKDHALRAIQLNVGGESIKLEWSKEHVRLPTIAGSPSSGALLVPIGLTGGIRGMLHGTEDGEHVRPDLMLPDDPQTDESAKSPTQCDTREELLLGAVMGTEGDTKIAAFMPCTVIQQNDLAHRFLDHEKHPDWQGRKRSMIVVWPDAQETLWAEYMDIRRQAFRDNDPEAKVATAFYKAHRKAMDAGAVVDDPHRKHRDELSALQHAENLLCDRGKAVFYAEYQNEPERAVTLEYVLDAETVASRTNALKIRTAPEQAHWATGFIDINHYGLHWTIVAVQQNVTGFVLDYGRFPAGGAPVVQKGATPSEAAEQVFAGLTALVAAFGRYELTRPNGRTNMDLLLIDCGYMPDVVFQFCKQARAAFRVMASRGAGSRKYRQARVIGEPRDNCHETEWTGKGNVVVHNADYWRSNVQRAFLKEPGAPGSISLYGEDARVHGEYARHIAAEKLIRFVPASAAAPYDLFDWTHVPGEIWDLLDCTVGSIVGAVMLGASLGGVVKLPRRTKPKRRKAKIQRDK